MKTTYELTEAELKQAVVDYITAQKNVQIKPGDVQVELIRGYGDQRDNTPDKVKVTATL